MAFVSLQKAALLTQNPIEKYIYDQFGKVGVIADLLGFEDVQGMVYNYITQKGLSEFNKREINGNLNEGKTSKVYTNSVQLDIYQKIKYIDRRMIKNVNMVDLGQFEIEEMIKSLALQFDCDIINADKTKGSKFDGAIKIANDNKNILDLKNTKIDDTNVYQILAQLENMLDGSNELVFLVDKVLNANIQYALKKSNLEFKVVEDRFGRQFTHFGNARIVPVQNNFVIDEDGETEKTKQIIPNSTTSKDGQTTGKIIGLSLGRSAFHGLKDVNGMELRSNLKNIQAGEQGKIDLETVLGVVGKSKNSVAVIDGILIG